MNQFTMTSCTNRALIGAAATIASALIFVGVLSLATLDNSSSQRAEAAAVVPVSPHA